jgi:hypothetical protein
VPVWTAPGRVRLRLLFGAFDEFAMHEQRTSADEGDAVGRVHGPLPLPGRVSRVIVAGRARRRSRGTGGARRLRLPGCGA